jgi:hypothetical protein
MIVDAFIFYNELDVLEIRLNELDTYVDQFILVESRVTHAGGPKELFFEKNKQRYSKWAHKIKHIIVEDMPTDENPWAREKYQRECILKGLDDVSSDSIVMVSDVDEIPDMSRIKLTNLPSAIHMWMFEYSFDFLFTGEPWIGTIITTVEDLKKNKPNFFRDNRWRLNIIPYAGWHLSSFGNAKHVLNKIQTYAHHADVGIFAEKTEHTFEKIIHEGIHHDGKTKLVPRTPDIPLPNSIRNKVT